MDPRYTDDFLAVYFRRTLQGPATCNGLVDRFINTLKMKSTLIIVLTQGKEYDTDSRARKIRIFQVYDD